MKSKIISIVAGVVAFLSATVIVTNSNDAKNPALAQNENQQHAGFVITEPSESTTDNMQLEEAILKP